MFSAYDFSWPVLPEGWWFSNRGNPTTLFQKKYFLVVYAKGGMFHCSLPRVGPGEHRVSTISAREDCVSLAFDWALDVAGKILDTY